MDAMREQLNRPLVAGIVGLIIGLIIGLPILGWWLWPVQYYDAAPNNLRADLQSDYMRMAIESYAYDGNAVLAKQRYDSLGSNASKILEQIQANPGAEKPLDIANFRNVALGGAPGGVPTPAVAATPTVQATTAPGGALNAIRTILPIMCVITLLLALALVAVFFVRNRGSRAGGPAAPAQPASDAAQPAEWTNYTATGEEPPMSQFMASYKLGDDLFDDSFSIDSPSGEFLGECGVGISEPIGVGDPKKVTAFEVWLFDKNDIQTVTKVLMSSHAFNDEAIRQKLAAKGEPLLATPGSQVVLETATLQLVARVVDMSYGEGALPPESFFENMILELAIWPK
ncbi:MAG: hypothetical protein ACM3PY_11985 [Omnitrophica WOR_2 bacterium]